MNRREFWNAAALTMAGGSLCLKGQQTRGRITAVAFDGFVIFDPRPVAALAEKIIPGRATEFVNLWRSRQFEYTWLRTSGQKYVDFQRVTEDALKFTAGSMKISLNPQEFERLSLIFNHLPAWPDVKDALVELRRRGIRLAILSNLTSAMLDANIAASDLSGIFEHQLTTDRVQAYKPSPRAYQMGVDAFGLAPDRIAFAAFAAWDVAGAKWFGYRTVWVNRASVVQEQLGAVPDLIASDMAGLLSFCGD